MLDIDMIIPFEETLRQFDLHRMNGLNLQLCTENLVNINGVEWYNRKYTKEQFIATIRASEVNLLLAVGLGETSKIGDRNLYAFKIELKSTNLSAKVKAVEEMSKVYDKFHQLPSINNEVFFFLSKNFFKTETIVTNSEFEIKILGKESFEVIPPSMINGKELEWDKDRSLISVISDDLSKTEIFIDSIEDINFDKLSIEENWTMTQVKDIVKKLPEVFRKDKAHWTKLGMALANAFKDTKDEVEALAIFSEFANTVNDIMSGEAFEKWSNFEKTKTGITIRTLLKAIKDNPINKETELTKFLQNTANLTTATLKKEMSRLDIKVTDLEFIYQNIADALNKNPEYNNRYNLANVRKQVSNLLKEIKEDKKEEKENIISCIDDDLANFILNEQFNNSKHIISENDNLFHYKNGVWKQMSISELNKIIYNTISYLRKNENDYTKLLINGLNDDNKLKNLNKLIDDISRLIIKIVNKSEEEDIFNFRNTRPVISSIINTQNKEIYITKGEITVEDHKYDSYLTNQFNCHYDPDADCPHFKAMLKRVFQNNEEPDDVIRHFLEMFGVAIQNKKDKDPAFMMLIGSGNNGKSFVVDVIKDLIGNSNHISTDLSKFSQDNFAESSLRGKLIVHDDDWKKGEILDDGFIKKITEEKTITAREVYSKPITFKTKCTVIINSNNIVKTKDSSEGIKRRAHVFNFNYSLREVDIDRDLKRKLTSERSGILNLLIKHFIQYTKRGHYLIPDYCQKQINAWAEKSNTLQSWLSDNFIITGQLSDRIEANKLWENYLEYMKEESGSVYNLSRNTFFGDIESIKNITVTKNSITRRKEFTGLVMKSKNIHFPD